MVIVPFVEHGLDLWNGLRKTQVVQHDSPRKSAGECADHPGVHVTVFQNILQSLGRLEEHRFGNIITVIQQSRLDFVGVERLRAVKIVRRIRIKLAFC